MSSHIPTDLQWADLVSRVKAAGSAIAVDSALSGTSENPVQNKVIYNALADKTDTSSLGATAFSNDYLDLDNLPTIPTVNNATLTIQVNGATVQTFTANSDSDAIANITVPIVDSTVSSGSTNAVSGGAVYTALSSKADSSNIPTAVSELTNDSGYQTATQVNTAIDAKIASTYKAAGSVAFANLPTLGSSYEGFVYNITDDFTTTADFMEGAGKDYPAGTNVAVINNGTAQSPVYKFDVMSGLTDLSGYVELTDYATTSTAGVVSIGDGLTVSNGVVAANTFSTDEWNALWA